MTQEEKAKAYDKSYKTAENIHRFSSDPAEIKRMEEIFPALKESEDEKIRKALINGFNKPDKSAVWYNGITNAQILAWLEKQGEQKPAWSEEDKDYYDTIITKLEITQDDASLTDNQMEFLKSLKNRVQLLPKQEWSEEDERCLTNAIHACKQMSDEDYDYSQGYIDAINWFKSLKERYTWKPSDEQIDALYTYIYNPQYFNSSDPRMELVESIYKDLKKLKE